MAILIFLSATLTSRLVGRHTVAISPVTQISSIPLSKFKKEKKRKRTILIINTHTQQKLSLFFTNNSADTSVIHIILAWLTQCRLNIICARFQSCAELQKSGTYKRQELVFKAYFTSSFTHSGTLCHSYLWLTTECQWNSGQHDCAYRLSPETFCRNTASCIYLLRLMYE